MDRLGIFMTTCAFISIHKDKNISINPYDMNMIITALFARPHIKTEASIPLCLPGISDDGYLTLTVKYVTPNLLILFATLSPEDHPQCLAKANEIARTLEQLGIVKDLTKSVNENYLKSEAILPDMVEALPAIVKDNMFHQAVTYNLSFFALTTGQRRKLRKMEEAYEKSVEPAAHKTDFAYFVKTLYETTYVCIKNERTIILLGSKYVSDKAFVKTAAKISDDIIANEESYFITKYFSEK